MDIKKETLESNVSLQSLVKNMDEIVFMCDQDSNLTFLNQSWERYLGLPISESLGHPISNFICEEDKENILSYIRQEVQHREIRFNHTNGTPMWFELTFCNNIADNTLGLLHNINFRKRLEEKVSAEREMLFAILDRLPAFVFIRTRDHLITYCNNRFKEYFGDGLGKSCYDILPCNKEPDKECTAYSSYNDKLFNIWEWKHPETQQVFQIYDYPFIDTTRGIQVLKLGIDITDLKKAESQDLKYKIIIDNMTDLVYTCDTKGNLLFVNNVFERLTGRKPEEVFDKPFTHLFTGDDLTKAADLYSRTLKGEKSTAKITFKDTGKLCEYKNFPLRDKKGYITGVIGTARDITAQKETEKHTCKLSQAVKQCPVVVIITNKIGNIQYVNSQFTRTTGYESYEAIGKNPRILKSGLMPYNFYTRLWSSISAGYVWSGRFHNRKKNGELYWEHQSISPVIGENGKIINFVAVKIDDTERVKAENEVRKIAQRFSRTLSLSDDAIISFNDEQQIILFNNGAERIFGYSQSEIIHKPITMLASEALIAKYSKQIEDISSSGIEGKQLESRTYLLKGVRKNGEKFPAEISVSKFKEDDKMVFTTIIRDITARKKMEEEMCNAQKLEAVGILAGGIAHDFNNILTAVLGYANLSTIFMNSGNKDKALVAISNIERATKQATDLTYQLLTFSNGGSPVKKLSAIASIIKDPAEFALRGADVKCEFTISPDLWSVELDEGQISQVIGNLVINADQAMLNGGIIEISAENINEEQAKNVRGLNARKYVMISITDHGIGIREEIMPKIFDPYFTTKETSSGLGLASAYSIINKHGGLITIKPKQRTGTTFYIYLPASTQAFIKENEETEKKPLAGSGKILVMDNEKEIRDLVAQALSLLGYNAVCAKDSKDTLNLYRNSIETGEPFDVIITDLTIPGDMGGKGVVKKLQEINPKVKTVVNSGYSNDPIMSDYKQYGFKGVITKPFDINSIHAVLQDVING